MKMTTTMDLSPNLVMKKEILLAESSSAAPAEGEGGGGLSLSIATDSSSIEGGDGTDEITPHVNDLFFDMKERWQTAYLEDLAMGSKCEYDLRGRRAPKRISSFMSSVAGAVKNRRNRRSGIQRSSPDSMGVGSDVNTSSNSRRSSESSAASGSSQDDNNK